MKTEFGCLPGDLRVAVGPSIGPCCYEIDEKVFLQEWKSLSRSKGAGKWMVDLPGINIAQIKLEGIHEDQIFRINLCTRCHPDLFFSYRGRRPNGKATLSSSGSSRPLGPWSAVRLSRWFTDSFCLSISKK